MPGQLFIFEGPDGMGKTTLSHRLVEWLTSVGQPTLYVSSPGRLDGTLGKLVYDIHHNPQHYGLRKVLPVANQLLHIAAHIDALHTSIIPALESGTNVVMDRFWWSTIAYGKVGGIDAESIRLMINLELHHWSTYRPTAIFLLTRSTPGLIEHSSTTHNLLEKAYEELGQNQEQEHAIYRISTDQTIEQSLSEIISVLNEGGYTAVPASEDSPRQGVLPLTSSTRPKRLRAPVVFAKLPSVVPSEVYDTYWRFAAMRQEVFFRRVHQLPPPWTDDQILSHFKFTNAYRASDRVSQFLIRSVIYAGSQQPDEVFFRTILFKLFNKIETWQLLESAVGSLAKDNFDLRLFDTVLTGAINRKQPIYSGAYIMPSGGKHGEPRKHLNHLMLLRDMLTGSVPRKITRMKNMRNVFELLRSYPMIGDFLAYQYAIDLNYGALTTFSEMEFVMPGPGARDGIRKCFKDLGGLSEADVIKMVTDRQEVEFRRLEIDFKSLWGRPLQLIDCQNLFCEVDKYARYAHPSVVGITGRTRIKQKFRSSPSPIDYWYPPKWGLNEQIKSEKETLNAAI